MHTYIMYVCMYNYTHLNIEYMYIYIYIIYIYLYIYIYLFIIVYSYIEIPISEFEQRIPSLELHKCLAGGPRMGFHPESR